MYAYFPINFAEFDDGELLHFAQQMAYLDPEARKTLQREIEHRGLRFESNAAQIDDQASLKNKMELSWYS